MGCVVVSMMVGSSPSTQNYGGKLMGSGSRVELLVQDQDSVSDWSDWFRIKIVYQSGVIGSGSR